MKLVEEHMAYWNYKGSRFEEYKNFYKIFHKYEYQKSNYYEYFIPNYNEVIIRKTISSDKFYLKLDNKEKLISYVANKFILEDYKNDLELKDEIDNLDTLLDYLLGNIKDKPEQVEEVYPPFNNDYELPLSNTNNEIELIPNEEEPFGEEPSPIIEESIEESIENNIEEIGRFSYRNNNDILNTKKHIEELISKNTKPINLYLSFFDTNKIEITNEELLEFINNDTADIYGLIFDFNIDDIKVTLLRTYDFLK